MLVDYVLDAVRVMGSAAQDRHPGMSGADALTFNKPKRRRGSGGSDVPAGEPKRPKGKGAKPGRPVSLRKTMDAIDARSLGWKESRRAAPAVTRNEKFFVKSSTKPTVAAQPAVAPQPQPAAASQPQPPD